MITDPATSPSKTKSQIGFAAAVAACYALFMELHIVFGLFYALTIVTAMRGIWLALVHSHKNRSPATGVSPHPTVRAAPAE
jgi:hypothetical protein